MRYLDGDVAYFVHASPYLALAKPSSAVAFLRRHVEAAEELAPVLRAYPGVRIEPLDFFYVCLRSLGALDQTFFEALLRDHTWRGVVWGAWLAMLDPRDTLVDPLRAAGPRWPHNEWLVDCAIATIGGKTPAPPLEAVMALAARCRRSLDGVPRPVVRLRPEPTDQQISAMEWERRCVRSAYVRLGAEAALRCLPGTLVGFYAVDYPRWVRSGAPDHG